MRISNNNNTNFGNLTKLAKPLSVFYDKNSVIPTLFIETGVTLGRTWEAYKKGGKKEAVERFVEQGVSAGVWLWGVQAIRNTGNFIADKLKITKNQNFKSANIIASTALATGFIGFVLPKINHYISKKIIEADKNKTQEIPKTQNLSLEEFKKKNNKNLSFTSISSFANLLENNATARLLITDTGVIAGRYKNGRNKYERIEGLFRDIASIYFYLRATKDFVNLGSKITDKELISKERLDELMKNPNLATAKDNKMIKSTFGLYALGTTLCAFALGILIPKAQYALRKALTNGDKFPGDDNFKVNN